MIETETCGKMVQPWLELAGCDASRQHFHSKQVAFIDGRIITPSGNPASLYEQYSLIHTNVLSLEHLPPGQLGNDILQKENRFSDRVCEIKESRGAKP